MDGKESERPFNKRKNSLTFKNVSNERDQKGKKVTNTPPALKTNFDKSVFQNMNVEAFCANSDSDEEIQEKDEKVGVKLGKMHSAKEKYKQNSKPSRFSCNKTPGSGESLSNKLSNFIENYENLVDLITHQKDTKVNNRIEIPAASKRHSVKNTYKSELCEDNIGSYITNIEKRGHKKEKEKDSLNTNLNNRNTIISINSNQLIFDNVIQTQSQTEEEEEEERCIILQSLTNTEDIKDFYLETEECLKRIAKLKVPPMDEIEDLLIDLPFKDELKHKRLAVFDLDETLVHCEIKHPKRGEHQIQVKIPTGAITKVGLNIRPLVKESLQEIQKHYVIIVYTASHQSYADSVLNFLDPDHEFIKYRLYRQNCVKVQIESDYIYVKDMRIFRGIHPKDIVIIDNSVLSFAFQMDNGIPILPFYNNKDDEELNFLTNYLTRIAKARDLREENKKSFKMDYFLQAAISNNGVDLEIIEAIAEESKSDSMEMFKLNTCKEDSTNPNTNLSLEISLTELNMNNSFNKEDSEEVKQSSSKLKYKMSDNSLKRASFIQDKLITTLFELKKSLEEGYNNSNGK